MQLEQIKTSELIPYANNARLHSDQQVKQIAASIKEFGFNNPVLIDKDNGIIAGHGRVLAAELLKLDTVPCIRLDHLTETQKKAYILADNRLAETGGGWNEELLKLELESLQELGFDIDLTGFDADWLAGAAEPKSGLIDDDEIPEEPEPVCKLGDLWQMGSHRLMCGDATDAEALKSLMGGEDCADMWLTDPPYNVAYTGKTKDAMKIKNDSMDDSQFREFLRKCYYAADSVLKPGAVFYIWHADSEAYNFRGAAADVGWKIRQCLIWHKNVMVMGRRDYHWQHEPCLYGWKDGAGHLWASDRKQTTILEFERPQRNGEHPTMKPVALFEYLMLNNTKGADIVLDSFGGSGTTLIAAEKNGRHSRLMELNPKYCDVIINRWENFTGRKAELANARQ